MQNRAMYPETIHPPVGNYAHAIEVQEGAKTLYVSGQVGIDFDGNIPDDFEAQADLVWDNLIKILEHNGMRAKDIVKVTHFLTDRSQIEAYGPIRAKYLGDERPASTLLLVAGLASPDFKIEVEMVAAIQRTV